MVRMCNDHNHNVNIAEALRYRDVGDNARVRLTKLFEDGHSPTSALDTLRLDLQEEYGDDYLAAAASTELCPTVGFCYR